MVSQFGQLAGPGVPDPRHYDDWKAWAYDLGQLMQTTQTQMTQAQIENLLRYAAGDWTPTLVGGTTPGTYSLTPTTARFVRIGGLVALSMEAAVTVTVAGTGDAVFGGLPVAMKAGSTFLGTCELGNAAVPAQMFAYAVNDTILIRGMTGATPINTLDIAAFTTGDVVGFGLCYLIDF